MCGQERTSEALGAIIGEDAALRAALARARLVAPTSMPVLVGGEAAPASCSPGRCRARSQPEGPLVAVNCGALPRELAEASCSATSAGRSPARRPAERDGSRRLRGDVGARIGELPLDLQPKLLRVLETGGSAAWADG